MIAVTDEELLEAFGNARIQFWTCPQPGHSDRTGTNGQPVVTVEWHGAVARCTASDCGRTSAGMRVLSLRRTSAPSPMGCRWCGVTQREHGQRWVPGRKVHGWVEPTRPQIEARMRARFVARRHNTPKEAQ